MPIITPPDIQGNAESIIIRIGQILNYGAKTAQDEAVKTLDRNKNYATGELKRRTSANVTRTTLFFGNALDRASDIETGNITKKTNQSEIESWLNRKIKLGHITDIKRNEIKQRAFFITAKINRTGKIKNWNPFMFPAWQKAVAEITKKINEIKV